jgi:hypothetical protein
MEKRDFDPAEEKNKDRKKAKKQKMHRVNKAARSGVRQDLRKLVDGIMTEEEFQEAHGKDSEIQA